MSDSTLAKSFEPHNIEAQWGPEWEKRGYAAPALRRERKNFSIQLPPPNVTGTLHMGHAFNQTIMDCLDALPPHARLQHAVGAGHRPRRHRHPDRRRAPAAGAEASRAMTSAARTSSPTVWEWKQESGSTITSQMRRMGDSVDWSHEYFTMDDKLSAVVTRHFVRLYEEGLIYRGKRLVNWDPVLKTAVSDLEVESEEEDGYLWHIRYPLADGTGHLTVATTRPETMLGDVAVMVHPEDERYAHLIGKTVKLPLRDREIPVIADDYVDREFGTGVVKVTPAHDSNDYAVGQRHGLPLIGVLTLDAKINDNAPAAVPRPRPLRRAQAGGRRPRGPGPARIRQAAQADGAALRAHRRSDRADAHRPVVRRDDQAGAGRHDPASRSRRRRSMWCATAQSGSCPRTGSTPTTSG